MWRRYRRYAGRDELRKKSIVSGKPKRKNNTSPAQRIICTGCQSSEENRLRQQSSQNREAARLTAKMEGGTLQRQEEKEETAQGKFTAQMKEEEETAQGKFTVQMKEEEETAQGKFTAQMKEEEETAQGKVQGSIGPTGIPVGVQDRMENSFNTDFSEVRVHTASAKATEVGALAYTRGNDVHFAPGNYKPETEGGRSLLGHELTHVKQQREGRVEPTTEIGGMPLNNDPSLEKEADDMGHKAVT